MANLDQIIEELDALSSSEQRELVGMLEDKWNVKVPEPFVMPDFLLPKKEEPTSFDVVLIETTNRIATIKKIRAIFGISLKEARDMAEGLPRVLKADVDLEEAERLKKELEEAEAIIEVGASVPQS